LANGTAKRRGLNILGELRNGTTTNASAPVVVSGISTVSDRARCRGVRVKETEPSQARHDAGRSLGWRHGMRHATPLAQRPRIRSRRVARL
jgi:hypothetical protein